MPDMTITDSPSLGVPDPPGGQNSALALSQPPAPYAVTAEGTQEYVAGGYYSLLGDYIRTLPAWVDPVTRDFGLDTYDRMRASDPQVASCIEVYKASVLADGWRIAPAQDTDEMAPPQPGKARRKKSTAQAQECADLCHACLGGLHATPFPLFLRQMLDGAVEGHKVAEIVLRQETRGKWAGKLVLDRLKPKPARSTAFVMDAYDNCVGLLGILPNVPMFGLGTWGFGYGGMYGTAGAPGMMVPTGEGADALQKNVPSLLPRSKFAVLTWDGQDGSPQGRSLLRRAFTPWWWKENSYGIWGKFISKHADPSLVGKTAEKAMATSDPTLTGDPSGKTVLQPTQQLYNQMLGFQNGSVIALPYGAELDALAVSNNGEAISLFADYCNKEIAKAILGQTLATEEGKHASRAQASVHAASKDDVTRYGQVVLTQMVIGDILRLLTLANYGPDAESLIPEFGLGQEETMSFADFAAGAAALTTSGYLHSSQYVGMDEMAGLPPRDEKAWGEELAAKQKQQEQSLALGDKAVNGSPGDKGNEGQAVIQKAEPKP